MDCGLTSSTVTCGGGRCGAGASLEQPPASRARTATGTTIVAQRVRVCTAYPLVLQKIIACRGSGNHCPKVQCSAQSIRPKLPHHCAQGGDMDTVAAFFQKFPELAIFLTLGVGYWVGSIRLGSFSLGAVTGTLLVGVVVGELDITISPNVKSVFFLMFLFALGYGVGPQFFRGLKSDGLPQVWHAVVVCVLCLVSTWLCAKFAGFDKGTAAGLLAGAQTISAVMGVATDTINGLQMPAEQRKAMIDHIPVAYAVTYIFG